MNKITGYEKQLKAASDAYIAAKNNAKGTEVEKELAAGKERRILANTMALHDATLLEGDDFW